MPSGKKIAVLLVALTVAAVFITPISNVVSDSTGTQSVTNTSATADIGNWSDDLEGYDVESGTTTVYWYNSSSSSNETLTEGTDYEFDYDDARVKILAGNTHGISDGDQLYVSYDYAATSGATSTVANLVPLFVVLLILVTIGKEVEV